MHNSKEATNIVAKASIKYAVKSKNSEQNVGIVYDLLYISNFKIFPSRF